MNIFAVSGIRHFYNSNLSNRGFSIGIGDVWASEKLNERKENVIKEQYEVVEQHIENLKLGELPLQAGCSAEETLENIVIKELSKIRVDAATACFRELSPFNAPLNMALCGSKEKFKIESYREFRLIGNKSNRHFLEK